MAEPASKRASPAMEESKQEHVGRSYSSLPIDMQQQTIPYLRSWKELHNYALTSKLARAEVDAYVKSLTPEQTCQLKTDQKRLCTVPSSPAVKGGCQSFCLAHLPNWIDEATRYLRSQINPATWHALTIVLHAIQSHSRLMPMYRVVWTAESNTVRSDYTRYRLCAPIVQLERQFNGIDPLTLLRWLCVVQCSTLQIGIVINGKGVPGGVKGRDVFAAAPDLFAGRKPNADEFYFQFDDLDGSKQLGLSIPFDGRDAVLDDMQTARDCQPPFHGRLAGEQDAAAARRGPAPEWDPEEDDW